MHWPVHLPRQKPRIRLDHLLRPRALRALVGVEARRRRAVCFSKEEFFCKIVLLITGPEIRTSPTTATRCRSAMLRPASTCVALLLAAQGGSAYLVGTPGAGRAVARRAAGPRMHTEVTFGDESRAALMARS